MALGYPQTYYVSRYRNRDDEDERELSRVPPPRVAPPQRASTFEDPPDVTGPAMAAAMDQIRGGQSMLPPGFAQGGAPAEPAFDEEAAYQSALAASKRNAWISGLGQIASSILAPEATDPRMWAQQGEAMQQAPLARYDAERARRDRLQQLAQVRKDKQEAAIAQRMADVEKYERQRKDKLDDYTMRRADERADLVEQRDYQEGYDRQKATFATDERIRYAEATKKIELARAALMGGNPRAAQMYMDEATNTMRASPAGGPETPTHATVDSLRLRAERLGVSDEYMQGLEKRLAQIKAGGKSSSAAAGARKAIEQELDQLSKDPPAQYRIPGWERSAGAPILREGEIEKVRLMSRYFEEIKSAADKLVEINNRVGPLERAGAAINFYSDDMALAEQYQQDVSTALRELAHMGVPQQFEIALTEMRAPTTQSLGGWLHGAKSYRSLVQSQETRMDAAMGQYGYKRAEGKAAAKASGGKKAVSRTQQPDGSIVVRYSDGSVEVYGE